MTLRYTNTEFRSTAGSRHSGPFRNSSAERGFAAMALIFAGLLCVSPSTARAQAPSTEVIGKLSGDDVSVKSAGATSVQDRGTTTSLTSGSELTLRSGHARIALQDGGDIDVCGPAHLSLFKTGGAVTVALDFGRVHPHISAAVSLNVFTPQIVATPVAIGESARDITVGLDQQGEMCAVAGRGALRIEQQLSGQSLLVPEGGATSLSGGQLRPLPSTTVNCTCEVPITQTALPGVKQSTAPDASAPAIELSVPAHSAAATPENPLAPPVSPAPASSAAQPVYRVDMPPLTFAAKSPDPPADPDAQTMLLVRQSRVETGVVFEGHVAAAPVSAAGKKPSPVATLSPLSQESGTESKKPGVFARLFGLFRKHSTPAP